ncbi:hypothetical protein ACIRPK_36135 [Kitasatospora sp. NPDC101801]|uniref:hypothetical protein n=1 Tax=Kitasatospora sp. NPDC101801 TaxID=3364103 RepID=UPI003827B337
MTTETTTPHVDARSLPVEGFTASDLARVNLGKELLSGARLIEATALMLCADEAVAGDYVASARNIRNMALHGVIGAAVIAERARGTDWERIGRALSVSAEQAEAKWGKDVTKWETETKAQSLLRREPAVYLKPVDEYVTTGRANKYRSDRQPLSQVLDAAADLTGRDVSAADRAFTGTEACSHCHR